MIARGWLKDLPSDYRKIEQAAQAGGTDPRMQDSIS